MIRGQPCRQMRKKTSNGDILPPQYAHCPQRSKPAPSRSNHLSHGIDGHNLPLLRCLFAYKIGTVAGRLGYSPSSNVF